MTESVLRVLEDHLGITPGSSGARVSYNYEIARVQKDPPEVSYDFNAWPPRIYYSAGGLAAVEPPTEAQP